jgi:streptogramin lyase
MSATLLLLCACGGGGGSGVPPAGSVSGSQTIDTAIQITVPNASKTTNAKLRRRYSTAWNTAGVTIAAYTSPRSSNPTAIAQEAFDVSAASSNCTAIASGRTCTFTLGLPGTGTDDFVTTSYDAAPVSGSIPVTANQLGIGISAGVVITSGTNPLKFIIDGVVASASILPPSATFPALSNGKIPVNVQALDADGGTIVADNYVDAFGNPVSIALDLASLSPLTRRRDPASGPGTLFSISPQSISSPMPNGVTLTYTSSGLNSAEFNNGFTLALTATPSNTGTAATASFSMPASNFLYTGMNSNADPNGIAVGPDKNIWFTEGGSANAIGTMALGGTYLSDIPIPTANANPEGVTTGPDGNVWFTEGEGENIGVINLSKRIVGAEYAVPATGATVANPIGITSGPDGNLWFTECNTSKIATFNISTHVITSYPTLTPNAAPINIVAGPDGNLWFTETSADKIGKITTSGTVTEYSVPTANASPHSIVVGPDGALWFTENSNNAIGRISTGGFAAEYPVGSIALDSIAVGADGNLWVSSNGFLARVTTSAVATVFSNTTSDVITGMVEGPDGNVYYLVDDGGANNAVGRIQL